MRSVLAVILATLLVVSVTGESSEARADEGACTDVTLVFARGSGQTPNFREAPRFFEKVIDRLDGISVTAYELGDEEHGGAQYEAHGISGSLQSYKNLIESELSWTGFLGGKYRASVSEGVTELTTYLSTRAAECPDEVLVVGGYSQGAQVIGDALPMLGTGIRDRIAFVPLFGDPKLYLPEGRGPFPPACRGSGYSDWRRGNVGCFTDNGILEARKPYVPEDIEKRVGSWCDRNDPICNNNLADFAWSAHDLYAEDGAEMDEAALEVAQNISDRLPEELAAGIDLTVFLLAAGADGIDVAFLIDTTGSMSGEISAAKSVADEVATQIVDLRGQVALTEYRDAGDSFVAEVRSPLTADIGAFRNALSGLSAAGGGDSPEALLTALMTTFDTLDWTPGATKAAVVLTDAGYHDPDVANGWTLADVVARSLEIDPVNVYPVVPSYIAPEYTTIAEDTAGQVTVDSGDTATALIDTFEAVTSRPVVAFPFDEYVAEPGVDVLFEVTAYDLDGDIASYEWDFDADGITDATTVEPTAVHAYPAPLDGFVEVRALSTDGGIGSASASVLVSDTGLAETLPNAPSGLAATEVDAASRAFEISWSYSGDASMVDGWAVLDDARGLLTRVDADQRSVEISDVPRGGAHVTVFGFNEYGSGPSATLAIAAEAGWARFEDVPQGHIFFSDIEWLARQGITAGCNPPANTLFCPTDQVTRGQMAAFLHRAMGGVVALGGPSAEFIDDEGSIFSGDIAWLSSTGITKGCAATEYCPESPVTRGQMAAFIGRALSYHDAGAGDLFVDDDDSIFETNIDRLATAGVTRGCNPPVNDMFCPDATVSREQMAAFLHRALG